MNLRGRLEDLAIPDILHVVGISHRSGELVVETGGREHRLLFSRGRLVAARVGARPRRLVDHLARLGVADSMHLAVLEKQAKKEGRSVPDLLEAEGRVSAAELQGRLAAQIEELVEGLRDAAEGPFEFRLLDGVADVAGEFGGLLLEPGLEPAKLPSVADRQRSGGLRAGLELPKTAGRRRARLLLPEDAFSLPSLRAESGSNEESRSSGADAPRATEGTDEAPAEPVDGPTASRSGAPDEGPTPRGPRVLLAVASVALRRAFDRALRPEAQDVVPVSSLEQLDRFVATLDGPSSAVALCCELAHPTLPGIEALARVRVRSREARVLVVADVDVPADLLRRAVGLGADLVVQVDAPALSGDEADELAERVRDLLAGGPALDGAALARLPDNPSPPPEWLAAGRESPVDAAAVRARLRGRLAGSPDAAEAALAVLAAAAKHLPRGVLACNLAGRPRVRGAFGDDSSGLLERVDAVLAGDDFLGRAAREGSSHVGPAPTGARDRALSDALGLASAEALVVILPIPGASSPVGVLYGEFAPEAPPDVEELSALIAEAGPALQAALERQESRDRARRIRLQAAAAT